MLYTFPGYEFKFSRRSLRIIGDEDFAELVVEPGENCFKGYIQALEFKKAVEGHGNFRLRFCIEIEMGVKRELKDEVDFEVGVKYRKIRDLEVVQVK